MSHRGLGAQECMKYPDGGFVSSPKNENEKENKNKNENRNENEIKSSFRFGGWMFMNARIVRSTAPRSFRRRALLDPPAEPAFLQPLRPDPPRGAPCHHALGREEEANDARRPLGACVYRSRRVRRLDPATALALALARDPAFAGAFAGVFGGRPRGSARRRRLSFVSSFDRIESVAAGRPVRVAARSRSTIASSSGSRSIRCHFAGGYRRSHAVAAIAGASLRGLATPQCAAAVDHGYRSASRTILARTGLRST